MSRKRKAQKARIRPTNILKRRKKAEAAKIKKAQTKLKEAFGLIKDIEGHEELDMAKHAIQYSHMQMSYVTRWLDGTDKEPLEIIIDTELEDSLDVEIVDNARLLPEITIR